MLPSPPRKDHDDDGVATAGPISNGNALPLIHPGGEKEVEQTNGTTGEAKPRDPESPNDHRDSPATTETEDRQSDFKEGGYGWVVVLCVFLINAHTWGLNSSYAVFLAYYLNSGQFEGADPIAFAFVGGLSFSIALLVSPVATASIRIYGSRITIGAGVIIQTAGLIGASFSTEIWHLLLSQGVSFGVGMGLSFTSTVGVVPQWFYKRRSFAAALSTGGSGFGGLIYSLGTNAMIENIGIEWAFRILAILSFLVNGTCCILFRDRHKDVGAVLASFRWQLFACLEFWLYLGWGFFSLFGYVIVVFSLPDYGQSVGYTASQGSIAAAILNLSQGIGRPLIGLASDRWGRINVCGMSTLAAGLSTLFIWIFAGKHYAGTVVYSLFGAFAGSLWPTVAPVGAEVVGLQLLPSALSIFWLILVLPATFAQPIALAIKEPGRNGYLGVQLLTGFMYMASFLCLWLLRVWKLRENEKIEMAASEEQMGVDGVGREDGDAVARVASRRSTMTSPGRIIVKGFLAVKHL